MRVPLPSMTQQRRAGLLAAVAVYPLSRLAGTLPRPTLDTAIVSGTTMAVTYQAAALTTSALRGVAGLTVSSPRARAARTAAAAAVVCVTAGVVAVQVRRRARAAAADGQRVPLATGAVGAAGELVAVAAGAGALVALADAVGATLPELLRPSNPAAATTVLLVIGGALGIAAKHPDLMRHLELPTPPGEPEGQAHILDFGRAPTAAARSVGVAAATVVGLTLEVHAAEAIGRVIGGEDPTVLAVIIGHGFIVAGAVAAGLAGFAFYSSRVAVEERILEAAYAAVPSRHGVSGGPDSAYEFAELGREGRRFVSQAYTADELSAVLGGPTVEPVRAFLPLSAVTGDVETDADTMVAEVDRLGGFTKGTLVLAAPTGDGYVSYVFAESVELLTRGDSTIVAVPYANLPSALALTRRPQATRAYAAYARALGARAAVLNPKARLFTFGESLGAWVAIDALGPGLVQHLTRAGFDGGLYVGVPIFSRTDRVLRPRDPGVREVRGLQYATGREQALQVRSGYVDLSHPTDPIAVADTSTLVRHAVDYWGRPFGPHIPLVSFLVHLADVKNAMNLRPGQFSPSPGHDYRYDTAAAVAGAYDLAFDEADLVEKALRERELAWSVRRLLSRQLDTARASVLAKLRSWGVDPETLSTRFHLPDRSIPIWLRTEAPDQITEEVPS